MSLVEEQWRSLAPALFETIRRVSGVGSSMAVSLEALDSRDLTDTAQVGGFAMAQMQAIHYLLCKSTAVRPRSDYRLLLQHSNALAIFFGISCTIDPTVTSDDRKTLESGAGLTQQLSLYALGKVRTPDPPSVLNSET